MDILTAATGIAIEAHGATLRADGAPYITHLQAVAQMLGALGHGPDVQAAAWLHDVVEDTDITLDDLAASGMPAIVVAAVDSVTVRPGEDYFLAVARAANHPIGALVKWADNAHNSSAEQLMCFSPERRVAKIRKYATARVILGRGRYHLPRPSHVLAAA